MLPGQDQVSQAGRITGLGSGHRIKPDRKQVNKIQEYSFLTGDPARIPVLSKCFYRSYHIIDHYILHLGFRKLAGLITLLNDCRIRVQRMK